MMRERSSRGLLLLVVTGVVIMCVLLDGTRHEEASVNLEELGKVEETLEERDEAASIRTSGAVATGMRPTTTTAATRTTVRQTALSEVEASLRQLADMGITIKKEGEWNVGVCTGTKDSGAWMREWIELQLLGGIDHVWVVNDNDDDSVDSTTAVLRFYEELGFVTVIPGKMPKWIPGCTHMPKKAKRNPKYEIDCAAPKYCGQHVADKVNWLIFADSDEFIYPHYGCSISDYVAKACPDTFSHVSLLWERYGTNGFTHHPLGLMSENFLSSGGDCGTLEVFPYANSTKITKTCAPDVFSSCSECRHTKMMWNTGRCCTVDHIGWIHHLTNYSGFRNFPILPKHPNPNGSPYQNKNCITRHRQTEMEECNAWLRDEASKPEVEFNKKCCGANIGYNHYGTKSLQYYDRKQRRAKEDMRGWRVRLSLIDLYGTISHSSLRFVRALRRRFRTMGHPVQVDVDFIDFTDNGLKKTCFKEGGYLYKGDARHGTKSIDVLKAKDTTECCKSCHGRKGCQAWTFDTEELKCSLISPSFETIHFGKKMNRPRFPRTQIPAIRMSDRTHVSGIIVRDECWV